MQGMEKPIDINSECRSLKEYLDDYKRKASVEFKSPNIVKVPLKEEDHESWHEFKKLAEGKLVNDFKSCELEEGKWPIELDHPFIPVIGDFAIDAFNEVIQMHVKKGISNNLCHHQIMACKYIMMYLHHSFESYCFFITMEAIEEGILGVYRAIVGCDSNDGSRTLVRFKLTDHTPSGKIAKTLPHLIHMKSRYKFMKGIKGDLEINLEATQKSMKGKKNKRKAVAEMIRLKEQHKAMKGACKVLYRQIRMQIPKTWNQRSDSGCWNACNYPVGWLSRRICDASRMGFDFYGSFKGFEIFALYCG